MNRQLLDVIPFKVQDVNVAPMSADCLETIISCIKHNKLKSNIKERRSQQA
jgi:hypothetical protein